MSRIPVPLLVTANRTLWCWTSPLGSSNRNVLPTAQGAVGQILVKSSVFVKEAALRSFNLSKKERKERLRFQRLIGGVVISQGPRVQPPATWSSALGPPLHPVSLTSRGGPGAGEGYWAQAKDRLPLPSFSPDSQPCGDGCECQGCSADVGDEPGVAMVPSSGIGWCTRASFNITG